ncbi:MAG: hypothetical protein IPM33_13690 [Phycisphaerales bacterium]|nr:hypothetical protein [Phycisphaerales bacterium]
MLVVMIESSVAALTPRQVGLFAGRGELDKLLSEFIHADLQAASRAFACSSRRRAAAKSPFVSAASASTFNRFSN